MNEAIQSDAVLEARIAADPRYTALVRDRQRFSWTLTAITMIVYSAFISSIAFDKPLMAQPVGGGTVSLAVLPGVAMLIGTVAICAIYVRRANVSYDVRLAELLASARARRRAFGAALLCSPRSAGLQVRMPRLAAQFRGSRPIGRRLRCSPALSGSRFGSPARQPGARVPCQIYIPAATLLAFRTARHGGRLLLGGIASRHHLANLQ